MKILCYGATGSQGNPVATELLKDGHDLRVLTRSPDKAQHLAEAGAKVVQGDMANLESLRSATAGREGVFLHIPFFTENPADGLRYAENAVEAAKDAGVRLLVWNASGEIPEQRGANPAFDLRLDILDIVKGSGIPYVVLQPTAYMENFLGPWTREELAQDNTFAYPTPEAVKMQWLATEDVGKFAAYAFNHPDLAPLNVKISGPERLSGSEVAARFSHALARDITFRAMPAKEFGEKLDAVFPGMGQGAAQGYALAYEHPEMFSTNVDIDAALSTMPVELTSLEQWARARKEAFE